MKELDRSWKNCLRMWKWISENLPDWFSESSNDIKDFVIDALKQNWLKKNKFTKKVAQDCFFCAYDVKHGNECESCPAGLVKRGFHCTDLNYHFTYNPVEFYNEIVRLNSKRRSQCLNWNQIKLTGRIGRGF